MTKIIASSHRIVEPIQTTSNKYVVCKVHQMQAVKVHNEDLFICTECGFSCPVRGISITGYNIPKEEP